MRMVSSRQGGLPLLFALALLVAVCPVAGEGEARDVGPGGRGAQDAIPLPGPAGWEELKEENKYDGNEDPLGKVIRTVETFYLRPPTPSQPPATDSRSTGVPLLPPPPPEPEAHILTTLGRLKSLAPVFNYLIHHPIRALTQYILPFLVRNLYHLARRLLLLLYYGIIQGYHLALLLSSPLLHLGHLALTPVIWAYSIFLSLAPIWASLLAAVLVGSGLGAIAGLATGESTRKLIDGVMGSVSGRKEGYLAAQQKNGFGKRGLKSGVGGGASFETISNKGKGKMRMMDADPSAYTQPASYLSTSYTPTSPASGRRPSDPAAYGSSFGGSSYEDEEGTDDDAISKTSSRTRTTGTGSTSGAEVGGLREGFGNG